MRVDIMASKSSKNEERDEGGIDQKMGNEF